MAFFVLPDLFCLSSYSFPVQTVPTALFMAVLSFLSGSGCFILAVLSWWPYSGSPCHGSPVLVALSSQPCPGIPVLTALSE